jgi:asparagine synthase (glutamine-hydrolysing)
MRREIIDGMNRALAHRGPDDAGLWQGAQADLGHRRLSVIDTSSASHQPMISGDGTRIMVFNGEIYNYRELRRELEGLGRVFCTEGDTEVLLEGYCHWGVEVFRRCNGMFAVAVYDHVAESLLLVRDRLGIKPLYYVDSSSHFAFSSELAPLVRSGLTDCSVNRNALDAYFQYLYTPGTETLYNGIRSLAPGTILVHERGEIRTEPFWELRYSIDPAWTLDSAAERLDELLTDSVRLRERSDVPLGAFLSGGVDSSCVVATLCRQRTAPLKTFSIGFDDAEANELEFARAVAHRYGTDHTEAVLKPDLAALLPEIVAHFGEPFADSSALPMWLVSRLAREQVTVALSGDGGDELFGGYSWMYMNRRVAQYRRVPTPLRRAAGMLLAAAPSSPRFQRVRRFHEDSFLPALQSFQRRLTAFSVEQRRALILPDFQLRDTLPTPFLEELWRDGAAGSDDERMLYADTRMYLPGDILAKVDRMSMAHGLEARVPLLDYRIVEFAATLPFALKYHGGISKRVLKHAMRDCLPASALAQRKRGFSLPVQRWMRGALAELFCDTVLQQASQCGEYLDMTFVKTLRDDHMARRDEHGHRLWSILMFELWLRWLRGK